VEMRGIRKLGDNPVLASVEFEVCGGKEDRVGGASFSRWFCTRECWHSLDRILPPSGHKMI